MESYTNWEQRTQESANLLRRIQRIVTSIVPGARIILYGSRARGSADISSDWDFLILTDHALNRKSILKIRDSIYDLELETGMILSSIIRTKEEWDSPRYSVLPFKHRVEQEGVLL